MRAPQMVLFNRGLDQIALDPAAIAQIVPGRDDGWTVITMHNRIEHCVNHELSFVLGKINAARAEGV